MTKKDQLITACSRGELEKVKLLKDEGVDLHFDDYKPYCVAAVNGNLDVVKFLLEEGADIHAQDDYAFKWADDFQQYDVLNYIRSYND